MDKPSANQSLATGGKLTQDTWADFVARLNHDCKGEGVSRHHTADALFVVQAKRYTYGIDTDYGAETVICFDESVYLTPKAFYENGFDEDERKALDDQIQAESDVNFLKLDESEQYRKLAQFSGVTVTGRAERWDYVSSHFTRDAADAFIARKAHDYHDGLRVYVEAQTYSWEFNAIKEAIMSGRLVLKNDESLSMPQGDLNQVTKAATVENSQGVSN